MAWKVNKILNFFLNYLWITSLLWLLLHDSYFHFYCYVIYSFFTIYLKELKEEEFEHLYCLLIFLIMIIYNIFICYENYLFCFIIPYSSLFYLFCFIISYSTSFYFILFLFSSDGIPGVKWFGSEGDYNVLVIDLLGTYMHSLKLYL